MKIRPLTLAAVIALALTASAASLLADGREVQVAARGRVNRAPPTALTQAQIIAAFGKLAGGGHTTPLPPPDFAGAISLTPGKPFELNKGAMAADHPAELFVAPEGFADIGFAGSDGKFTTNSLNLWLLNAQTKLLLVDCLMVELANGKSNFDNGSYSYRAQSAGTPPVTGTASAENGHLLFVFRANGVRTEVNITRAAGAWETHGCTITPQT